MLRFSSEVEAMQYLSDITGAKVIVAADLEIEDRMIDVLDLEELDAEMDICEFSDEVEVTYSIGSGNDGGSDYPIVEDLGVENSVGKMTIPWNSLWEYFDYLFDAEDDLDVEEELKKRKWDEGKVRSGVVGKKYAIHLNSNYGLGGFKIKVTGVDINERGVIISYDIEGVDEGSGLLVANILERERDRDAENKMRYDD